MNKERFHNQLALRLGYDRIVNDKRFIIKVDYDNPGVFPNGISEKFKASEDLKSVYANFKQLEQIKGILPDQDIIEIIDAVHQAYLESNKNLLMI